MFRYSHILFKFQFRADIDDKNVQVFTHTLQVFVQVLGFSITARDPRIIVELLRVITEEIEKRVDMYCELVLNDPFLKQITEELLKEGGGSDAKV